MKTTSCYPVFIYPKEKLTLMLEHAEKYSYMTVAHHFSHEALEGFVLKDASGNRVDMISPKSDALEVPEGVFGIRLNVDDYEAAVKELQAAGYEVLVPAVETPSSYCVVLKGRPSGFGFNVVLFQHKKN